MPRLSTAKNAAYRGGASLRLVNDCVREPDFTLADVRLLAMDPAMQEVCSSWAAVWSPRTTLARTPEGEAA